MPVKIQPVTIDRAVRSLGGDDILNFTSISEVMRELAQRDSTIADAVNRVVSRANEGENLVHVSIPWMNLGAASSIVCANFRIPKGFEAKIVNASITSLPATKVTLQVIYNPKVFGQDTAAQNGTLVVETLTETTAETSSFGNGEFVVKLASGHTRPVKVVGSVLLSVRRLLS